MALLDENLVKIQRRAYEFSKHAVDRSIARDISVAELETAMGARAEVVEDYADDKYGPSCLVLGFTDAGRPLHVHCSYPSSLAKIIMLYKPDPERWMNFRTRKPNQ